MVLGLKECLVECATLCIKSEVILEGLLLTGHGHSSLFLNKGLDCRALLALALKIRNSGTVLIYSTNANSPLMHYMAKSGYRVK